MRVRRLRARRKADRIVTERYHRGSSKAETGARPQVRIAGALISHDSGNLHHRPSEDGGCDAVTEATEGSPFNRSRPICMVAPPISRRNHRRRYRRSRVANPHTQRCGLCDGGRRKRNRRRAGRRNTPVPRLGLRAFPHAANRRISRISHQHKQRTFRVTSGT